MKNLKLRIATLAITLSFLFACSENEQLSTDTDLITDVSAETTISDGSGELIDVVLDGELVTMERFGDHLIFEGDMIFEVPENGRVDLVGYTSLRRWPNKTLYYQIDPAVNYKRSDIEWAVNHINQKTNVTIKERTNETDYVLIKSGSGCGASLGYFGGRQSMSLASGCSRGSIAHEFLHALGVKHEHTKLSRDNYLNIHTENIQSGSEHNFSKASSNFKDWTAGMDYGSIMMYGPKFFSKNGQPTISRKDGQSYSSQRNGLSNDDVTGINLMYPN